MDREIKVVGLQGKIEWELRTEDSNEYSLMAFPGWSIVTPLAFLRAFGEPPVGGGFFFKGHGSNRCLISTESILLSRTYAENQKVQEPDETWKVVQWLLPHLRYYSRQALIPRGVVSLFSVKARDYKLPLPEPLIDFTNGGFARDYLIETTLKATHLAEVSSLDRESEIPVYADLLLDGLAAQIDGDHRKAILYAAMAIESLTSLHLERLYKKKLTSQSPNSEFRIVTIPTAGGNNTTKDPVYEALCSKDSFQFLLHERPLYLMQRSLQLDEPDVYRQAIELYKTRNKIAHGEEPQAEGSIQQIDRDGAISALKTALNVFDWFGYDADYTVWKDMRPY